MGWDGLLSIRGVVQVGSVLKLSSSILSGTQLTGISKEHKEMNNNITMSSLLLTVSLSLRT